MSALTHLQFDDLVEESINLLCSDNINQGAEALLEIAQYMAKAGLTQQSFYDLRQFIVMQAEERTSKPFIREKLTLAERERITIYVKH